MQSNALRQLKVTLLLFGGLLGKQNRQLVMLSVSGAHCGTFPWDSFMDDIRKRHIEVLVSSSRQKMNMHNAAHTTMDSNSILKERYIHKDKVGSVFAYIRATVGMGFSNSEAYQQQASKENSLTNNCFSITTTLFHSLYTIWHSRNRRGQQGPGSATRYVS